MEDRSETILPHHKLCFFNAVHLKVHPINKGQAVPDRSHALHTLPGFLHNLWSVCGHPHDHQALLQSTLGVCGGVAEVHQSSIEPLLSSYVEDLVLQHYVEGELTAPQRDSMRRVMHHKLQKLLKQRDLYKRPVLIREGKDVVDARSESIGFS